MEFIKKIFKKKKSNKAIMIIICATVFGLAGGIAGQLFSRSFIFDGIGQVPYWGEINLNNINQSQPFVIHGPRKVVVEQDLKIQEIINAVNNNVVGIFRKIESENDDNVFNGDNYYTLKEERGQGLVITSDGWIITSAFSPNIRSENEILADYVVITKNKKIYKIDKLLRDTSMNFSFIHLEEATNLNAINFVDQNNNLVGVQVLIPNWDNENLISFITNYEFDKNFIRSSDDYEGEIKISSPITPSFYGSGIYNLEGTMVGLIDNQGKITPINNLRSILNSVLKNSTIKTPELGVYYINLEDIIIDKEGYNKGAIITKNDLGVSIAKDSPAEKYGLKEGDVILSIDNIEVSKNEDLNKILQNYSSNDQINVKYWREGAENTLNIILD